MDASARRCSQGTRYRNPLLLRPQPAPERGEILSAAQAMTLRAVRKDGVRRIRALLESL